MRLQESGEMYLESMYVLQKKNGRVRSLDVAEHMGYSKPSVSRAVAHLKAAAYITVDKDGYISLTNEGRAIAEKIFERHTVLCQLFMRLGVSEEIATRDACRIEHAISDETFFAIKAAIKKHPGENIPS